VSEIDGPSVSEVSDLVTRLQESLSRSGTAFAPIDDLDVPDEAWQAAARAAGDLL